MSNLEIIKYYWDKEEHEPLDGAHDVMLGSITVTLSVAMQERIAAVRSMLKELEDGHADFLEGEPVVSLKFDSFEIEGCDSGAVHGRLDVCRRWLYLSFHNRHTDEKFELALTAGLELKP